MDTKHTPGPWSRNIAPARKYPTIFAGRNTHVAKVESLGLTEEEVEANANLIAAAPDLLETLELMEQEKSDYMIRNNLGDPSREHTNKLARAAIAKARGQS